MAKATDIARAIVMRYGMLDQLGLVAYEAESRSFLTVAPLPPQERRYSDETAREIAAPCARPSIGPLNAPPEF